MKGRIKRLFHKRGFGFITAEDGREIFFHCSALKEGSFESLKENTQVEFEIKKDRRGFKAVEIKIIK